MPRPAAVIPGNDVERSVPGMTTQPRRRSIVFTMTILTRRRRARGRFAAIAAGTALTLAVTVGCHVSAGGTPHPGIHVSTASTGG